MSRTSCFGPSWSKALAYNARVIAAGVVLFIPIGMAATQLSKIGYSRPTRVGTFMPG